MFNVRQVGLSQARRLAQGNVIRLHIHSPFPVQVDGEPWIQQPGCLEITHHGQVSLSFLTCIMFVWLNLGFCLDKFDPCILKDRIEAYNLVETTTFLFIWVHTSNCSLEIKEENKKPHASMMEAIFSYVLVVPE